MKQKFDTTTDAWLDKVAEMNNCTKEDVLKYIDSLSSGRKVMYHLKLA